jgi:hypothetical protein
MKFNKLSKALQPLSLSASSILELNDSFKMVILHLAVSNQAYNARSADYFRNNPSSEDFFTRLYKSDYSDDIINFVANVIILDWELSDDDGNKVEFSVGDAIELLKDPRFGSSVFTKIISHTIVSENFETKWEEEVTKN